MQIFIPWFQTEINTKENSKANQTKPKQFLYNVNEWIVTDVGESMNATAIEKVVDEKSRSVEASRVIVKRHPQTVKQLQLISVDIGWTIGMAASSY